MILAKCTLSPENNNNNNVAPLNISRTWGAVLRLLMVCFPLFPISLSSDLLERQHHEQTLKANLDFPFLERSARRAWGEAAAGNAGCARGHAGYFWIKPADSIFKRVSVEPSAVYHFWMEFDLSVFLRFHRQERPSRTLQELQKQLRNPTYCGLPTGGKKKKSRKR